MATYTLISSNVLASSAASVTFSSIPATYTDLVLKISSRASNSAVTQNIYLEFNGNTSAIYSRTLLSGTGAAAGSSRNSADVIIDATYAQNGDTATASSFGSAEVYIPSYTVSQNKPISVFGAGETNATTAYMGNVAGLFGSTTAISSIKLSNPSTHSFITGSSFYLYGISNA